MENAVTVMLQSEATVSREEALEQVVAVVREKAMFTFLELRQRMEGGKGIAVVTRPLSEWFVRALVIDAPRFMRVVNEEDLKAWDLSADELFEIGLQRVRDASSPKFAQEDGYFVGGWDDDYDSSRVLVEDLFEDLPIEGQPVYCIPNRRMLLAADSANPAAVRAMLAKAEEIVQANPRPQNPGPLTYRNGELTDFQVPATSEVFEPVQRARGLCGVLYYDEQKAMIDDLHEKTGKDIYVGKFTLMQREDGKHVSYCVWSRDVASLLPKADLILFNDPTPDGKVQTVPVEWSDAFRIAGDLMLDADMFPPRFYVSKFPSAEQFARMPKVEF
jgi:hypothetical protein